MTTRSRLLRYALPAGLAAVLTACSPCYVMRAAYEQGRLLARREPIAELIKDTERPQAERDKLQLVLDAREFGVKLGLKPEGAFTKYAKTDFDVLVWVVSASRPDAFGLYQWWFPIVGSIPYKGFFEEADAKEEAARLEAESLETWVRGAEAFSTLGWFDDPVLSTTLKHAPADIVNTVLHESLHSTIWLPEHVDFNESLAEFVGDEAGVAYFMKRLADCPPEDQKCQAREQNNLAAAERNRGRDYALNRVIGSLYAALDTLYQSDLALEEKLQQRRRIFSAETDALRSQYPELRILKQVNNAEILQLKLYLGGLNKFAPALASLHGDWHSFLTKMAEIKKEAASSSERNPFEML
jgi:predicted aminopeptidase